MEKSINEELVKKINNEKELHKPILYINHPDFVRINNIIGSVWKGEKIKEWNPAFHEIDFKDLASGKSVPSATENTTAGRTTLSDFLRRVYNNNIDASCIVLRNVLSYFRPNSTSRIELITSLQLISQKIQYQEGYNKTIVILSYEEDSFPNELSTYTRRFDTKDFMPKDNDIEDCIKSHFKASEVEDLLDQVEDLVKQYRGLQLYEIDRLIDTYINSFSSSKENATITEEKNSIVNASGFFEIINPEKVKKAKISGYTKLRDKFESLKERSNPEKYKNNYEPYGIPKPKGYLLYGPPGCGKSEISKIIAKEIDLADKLYKLDIGRLMGQYVGQSEANLRKCLDIVEAAAPCVLWIDEIEKALAGTSSGRNEEAYSMRMLQTLLTWMQERDSFVFIVATANELKLRPELIRKGRFDDHFEVGYPSANDAESIFKQYLSAPKKREEFTTGIDSGKVVLDLMIDKGKVSKFEELEMSCAFIKSVVDEYIIKCINEKTGNNNTKKESTIDEFVDFVWEEYVNDRQKRKKNEQDNQ